jgi:hypothetical protein
VTVFAVDPNTGGARITYQTKALGWPLQFAAEDMDLVGLQPERRIGKLIRSHVGYLGEIQHAANSLAANALTVALNWPVLPRIATDSAFHLLNVLRRLWKVRDV